MLPELQSIQSDAITLDSKYCVPASHYLCEILPLLPLLLSGIMLIDITFMM